MDDVSPVAALLQRLRDTATHRQGRVLLLEAIHALTRLVRLPRKVMARRTVPASSLPLLVLVVLLLLTVGGSVVLPISRILRCMVGTAAFVLRKG